MTAAARGQRKGGAPYGKPPRHSLQPPLLPKETCGPSCVQVLERIAARACYGFFEGFSFVGKQNWKEWPRWESEHPESCNLDCYKLGWGT